MNEVLRCCACGGAVVWDAARSSAACLFCATPALEIVPEPSPTPDLYLAPKVSSEAAARSFRAWATKSWFRPAALRGAELDLQPMLLPVWRVEARLETHWAGLRRAATRSGRSPDAGVDHVVLRHVIPASAGLRPDELTALSPFEHAEAAAWAGAPEGVDTFAWELPALTRRAALTRARRELLVRHRRRIVAEAGLVSARVSALIDERAVALVLVPIHIGSFRFRDRPWRVLVNGQTGAVVGEAPRDRKKVALVVLAVLAVVALIVGLGLGGSPG